MEEDDIEIIAFEEAEPWGGPDGLVTFYADAEERLIGEIPLSRLANSFDPFVCSPWHDGQGVSFEGVTAALEEGRFEYGPYSAVVSVHENNWGARRHEARIAYLVVHKSEEPIEVQFSTPDGDSMSIDDGHHRLAAAIYRKDPTISVELGGYLSAAIRGLGIICPESLKLGVIEFDEKLDLGDELIP